MARLQLPNPPPSSPAVRAVMQANRAHGTGPERRLTLALRQAGLGGYRLNWKRVPGRPDISYPGRRLAIFVHGCYWHHCPRCHPDLPKSNARFWARKFELNHERDARKRRQLEALGWQVHEIWECDIRDRLDERVRAVARDLARDLARPALAAIGQRPAKAHPARTRARTPPSRAGTATTPHHASRGATGP